MLLTIHDANLKKVAFIDNDKQETLNYYDDIWTRSLETGSSTFEFTVYKKAIKSDTAINKTYNLLNERAFVSFRYHGKSYVFNVMTVEENEQTITCYCENLNLELINEYANPYKATKAMSFVEYCNAMELLNFTHLSVGINEVSDQKRTLEWEGRDTKLARLLSLAKKFDAEIDFDTQLNADSSIKSFKVNVYHENDDKHQGVGRVRNDIQLTYGKNLKSITRKIDKTGIYTMVRPYGKKTNGENETIISIGNLSAWSENNADGVREFYQSGDGLYAPLAAQMYPSTFTSGTQADQWIRKDLEVDSDNPTVIRAAGIANLKKNAYPAITYDVDGFIDVDVGDTVKIYDDGFSPILLVKARVSDQKISFTNPNSNKTTFANFKALENNLSDGIQTAFERLFEASKPYLIKLSTDNGVIFKNQIGQSIITPSLYKGGKPVTSGVTWRWSLDGNVTTGMTYTVRGANVTDTATLTIAAYIGNDEVAVDEISFVNVLDGTMGTPGPPGKDGRTPYVHTAWANNSTGTSGFSLDSSVNKLYIGIYTDFEPADSQDPTKYNWTLIKGEKGDQGIPGVKGADGRTQYTHIAYADNATGGGFSQTDQTKAYIGMYQDFVATDSDNPTSYRWTKWKGTDGAQGVPGPKGADGRTPYIHWAYSDNADGTGLTLSDNGQRYMGHYSDYTQADSTDKTKYTWADRWAKIEVGGENLVDKTGEPFVMGYGITNTTWDPNTKRTRLTFGTGIERAKSVEILPQGGVFETQNIVIKRNQTYTQAIRVATDATFLGQGNLSYSWFGPEVANSSVNYHRNRKAEIRKIADNEYLVWCTTTWNSPDIKLRPFYLFDLHTALDFRNTGTYIEFYQPKLETGTIPTAHTLSENDRQSQIDTKADQELTQEQLNALNEKNQILESEMQAKATMQAFSELEKAYYAFVAKNEKDSAQSEQDLIEASRRIELLTTQFGGLKELKTFIDTYMSSSNEGLIIGKNDASSTIKVSSERISMFSAGEEVMYISQGVIHIDNGIFTKSLQIGRFRTEQYELNADMNVIRYVG